MGDTGCYSFHAIKGITCGEGGAIVAKEREMADRARRLCNYGIESAWDRQSNVSIPSFTSLGYNCKISDLQSAVALAQLNKIDRILERREKLARAWSHELSSLVAKGLLVEQSSPQHITPCHQSRVIILSQSIDRNRVIMTMRERFNIETTIGTYACHEQPVYRSKDSCPISKSVADQSLSLPFYYELTMEAIQYCAKSLTESIELSRRSD
jgi:dTDP-4-amino-4,6-dideoxygalactose transaminase